MYTYITYKTCMVLSHTYIHNLVSTWMKVHSLPSQHHQVTPQASSFLLFCWQYPPSVSPSLPISDVRKPILAGSRIPYILPDLKVAGFSSNQLYNLNLLGSQLLFYKGRGRIKANAGG